MKFPDIETIPSTETGRSTIVNNFSSGKNRLMKGFGIASLLGVIGFSAMKLRNYRKMQEEEKELEKLNEEVSSIHYK